MSELHDFLQQAVYIGRADKGEIEIVTNKELIREARIARAEDKAHFPTEGEFGIVFQDEYVIIVRDLVRYSDGGVGTYIRIFERAGLGGAAGVVIVAIKNGRIYLRRTFRHATRAWELEFPRGFRGLESSSVEAVEQEVWQELGFHAARVRHLGRIYGNTGLLASYAEAYLVDLGASDASSEPEAQEAFREIIAVSARELKDCIARGEIRDAFTLSATGLSYAQGLLPLDE